ncbi:iron-siderophore ABC transporter substrate-binding protein [Paenibacillus sp. IB182496]|uniref:Iron-siderophore ABC transporter substrate-binding protein n=1 Tax=Paenibacillus sabuli TaxID=2772509 RepID=A0A927GRD9_9BACL|nr:iron-siderophore ABC transporter substrate-binding protein [Paenibacillus sabuli]MBD2844860.1 iron-siderophore ABC transporter substrate-binding protein [Paenibacillus sabuli]
MVRSMYSKRKLSWSLMLLVTLMMLLGACANNDDQADPGTGAATSDESQTGNTDAGGPAEGTSAGTDAEAGNAAEEADESADPSSETAAELDTPVTIPTLKGEITLEQVPERIVVLDVQYADQMLALGERPAGSVIAGTDGGLPPYLGDQMDDIPLLGTYVEPNLEGVLAASPDLILATEFHEDIYEDLLKIAPTLMLERNEDWQTVLAKMGQILNKQQEAQDWIAAYDQKISTLKASLAEKMSGQIVALVRPRDGLIRLQTTSHRTSQILYDDLGLTPPEMAVNDADTSTMISLEVLPELEAEHMFLLQDDTNAALTQELQNTSIWENLKAVQANHVYEQNTAQWVGYYGPIAIDLIVDQIAEALE